MASVLIADDQALLRGTFRLLIDSDPVLWTVGEAENGAEAVELARACQPDVVLMDIRMPVLDGVEATRQICAEMATKVLVLTMFDLDQHVFAALRAGASGFLLKDTPPAELLSAIRIVAAGEALLSPSVTRRLIAEFGRTPELLRPSDPGRPTLTGVTQREEDVLRLVGRGLSNAEIAGRLHLGVGTVKTHVSHLLGKLGVRDRAQLVVMAYESGLITPNSGSL
ncbi:response regulator transcription factor [Kutzneria sp. 744]|uniref:response regulator n=1 Tax=Kutzneria sp. (strain 744) TaxID=345341 RepID=UPI0003EEA5D4|nr:response regulator transcription factor [Kutzneria sp. 744]EWM16264.1 two-component system, NarL family, response regulator [Kutzneria sp. 744]